MSLPAAAMLESASWHGMSPHMATRLQQGFRGQIKCPVWLLDYRDAIIIPLAWRNQTNPIYSTKPGGLLSRVLVPNCLIAVAALGFDLGRIGGLLFLSAEVHLPEFGVHGWINIWQGTSLDFPGTLYCALGYLPAYGEECLCGSCPISWSTRGWVCPLLQW